MVCSDTVRKAEAVSQSRKMDTSIGFDVTEDSSFGQVIFSVTALCRQHGCNQSDQNHHPDEFKHQTGKHHQPHAQQPTREEGVGRRFPCGRIKNGGLIGSNRRLSLIVGICRFFLGRGWFKGGVVFGLGLLGKG